MSFRIRATPTGNVNAGVRVMQPPVARVFEHVRRADDDDDLTEAGREMSAPDYEVGSIKPTESGHTTETHADHVEYPVYKDAIPWGPERAVARVPFKMKVEK